jgi:hypothetical protein
VAASLSEQVMRAGIDCISTVSPALLHSLIDFPGVKNLNKRKEECNQGNYVEKDA